MLNGVVRLKVGWKFRLRILPRSSAFRMINRMYGGEARAMVYRKRIVPTRERQILQSQWRSFFVADLNRGTRAREHEPVECTGIDAHPQRASTTTADTDECHYSEHSRKLARPTYISRLLLSTKCPRIIAMTSVRARCAVQPPFARNMNSRLKAPSISRRPMSRVHKSSNLLDNLSIRRYVNGAPCTWRLHARVNLCIGSRAGDSLSRSRIRQYAKRRKGLI